jgi:hypothetical protein
LRGNDDLMITRLSVSIGRKDARKPNQWMLCRNGHLT